MIPACKNKGHNNEEQTGERKIGSKLFIIRKNKV